MTLRQISGLALLALGIWLFYGALQAVLAFTERGGDVMSALFEPPTSAIRLIGALAISVGGLLVAFKTVGGGATGVAGSILFITLGGLMAASGAAQGLWLDEIIYGVAALTVSGLILTFRRA